MALVRILPWTLLKIYRSRERIFKLNFKYSTVGGKMGCAEKILVALL